MKDPVLADSRARLSRARRTAADMLHAYRQWPQTTESLQEYQHIIETRLRFCRPVTQPICLISQIQRSGGTLLSQLFDGHPQLHAYPQELKLNKPKFRWPSLDLAASPEEWFAALQGDSMTDAFLHGYTKSHHDAAARDDRFPMLLPLGVRRSLFLRLAPRHAEPRQREVLDAFLTSLFYAWLDNHNLYSEDKEWVPAFTARVLMEQQSVDGFFRDYPDGRMISIVRDPRSWYVSASRMRPELYGQVGKAAELWRHSTESALDLAAHWGDRVRLVLFEDLVQRTPDVMRNLADWLQIGFRPELLEPTFNSMSIRASSSFAVNDYGIVADPVSRREPLDAKEEETIAMELAPLYQRVGARYSCAVAEGRAP